MCLRIAAIFFLTFSFASQITLAQNATTKDSSLATRRAAHLHHGINLSEWFGATFDPRGYTKEHFETSITAQDLALIHDMGFDHVRLCLSPRPMFRYKQGDQISGEYLSFLDTAIQMILDHGLAVELDIHPDPDFKKRLSAENDWAEGFTDFWRALAQHYSSLDPDKVFFEILNEPEITDPYRWYGLAEKLAGAIREGAPQHTIIVAGARWSDDDDLVFLEPLRDPNVIYNFHFYEPHIFTHQGATWGVTYWHYLKGLSYPSDLENARKVAAQVPDPPHRLQVLRYGMDHWNAARIDVEIGQVAEWAKRWNVPVICNEFGVYRKNADPKERAAWISDVRTALEKYGFGWTMWDYNGGFAVVNKQPGQPSTPDELTVRALGRPLPSAPKP